MIFFQIFSSSARFCLFVDPLILLHLFNSKATIKLWDCVEESKNVQKSFLRKEITESK